MGRTPGNDKKHQDSKNYLPEDGNTVTKGTGSQQQLWFISKFSRNGISMLVCQATKLLYLPTTACCQCNPTSFDFCGALGVDPGLCILGMHSTADLHAQPSLLPAVKKQEQEPGGTHLGGHLYQDQRPRGPGLTPR